MGRIARVVVALLATSAVGSLAAARPPATAATGDDTEEPIEVARGLAFAEGPLRLADGTRWWVDAYRHAIVRQRPGEAPAPIAADVRVPTGLALGADGRLRVAEYGGGRIVAVDPDDGAVEVLAERHAGRRLNAPNDLVLDADGGLWFTDPALLTPNRQRDQQVLYRSPEGAVTRVAGTLRMPNGIGLTPDGAWLLVAEFGAGRVWRYPVLGPGVVGERERFTTARTPSPDGLCIHADGRVFVAIRGALAAFDADGTRLDDVDVPGDPTNCSVSGDRLLVTLRHRVLELSVAR